MKRVKLPKDVWVSLYGKLHDILYDSMMHKDIDGKECTDDDVSYEVLKLMDSYFDRSFGIGQWYFKNEEGEVAK
jgi:hypothetical protein